MDVGIFVEAARRRLVDDADQHCCLRQLCWASSAREQTNACRAGTDVTVDRNRLNGGLQFVGLLLQRQNLLIKLDLFVSDHVEF